MISPSPRSVSARALRRYTPSRITQQGGARANRPSGLLRLRLVGVSIIFIACIVYAYQFYLSPVWGYMGYTEFDPHRSGESVAVAIACAVVLCLLLPVRITKYSHFVVIFLFFFLYIPCTIIVALQGAQADGATSLVLVVAASFTATWLIPEIFSPRVEVEITARAFHDQKNNLKNVRRQLSLPDIIFLLFAGSLMAAVFIIFGNMMRIVSFYDVYSLRSEAAELGGNGSFGGYAVVWLTRAVGPIALAVALIYKKRTYIGVTIASFTIGYAVVGAKFLPAAFVILLALHYFVMNRPEIESERLALLALTGLAVPLTIMTIFGLIVNDALDVVLSQAVARMYGTAGMILGQYGIVFQTTPLTYYSHIGPLRYFVDYPFGELSVGQVVGHAIANKLEYNANASYLATDGIAAFGYAGVLLSGIGLGFVLLAFNRISAPAYLRLMCMATALTVWMLVDGPITSTILSGGWWIAALFVPMFYRAEQGVSPGR